jgi:predicted nucleotidyltransferase
MGIIIPIMGIIQTSLTNVLFSKAQQKLLGLLYGQPDADFHTNEIIRLTNSGTGAIQRELEKFTNAEILIVKQVGNQKRYQANPAMPFFAELRSIVLKTFGLADILRTELMPLAKHIKIAFIYGSIAEQKDTARSDIDLMIISDNITYAELFPLLEKAETKISRPINPAFYSPHEWIKKHKEKNNFICQVIKKPKIFLLGTEDELAQFR